MSGLRIFFWVVLGLATLGGLLSLLVLPAEGVRGLQFEPRLLLFFVFFVALHAAFFIFMRGRREERRDLP